MCDRWGRRLLVSKIIRFIVMVIIVWLILFIMISFANCLPSNDWWCFLNNILVLLDEPYRVIR